MHLHKALSVEGMSRRATKEQLLTPLPVTIKILNPPTAGDADERKLKASLSFSTSPSSSAQPPPRPKPLDNLSALQSSLQDPSKATSLQPSSPKVPVVRAGLKHSTSVVVREPPAHHAPVAAHKTNLSKEEHPAHKQPFGLAKLHLEIPAAAAAAAAGAGADLYDGSGCDTPTSRPGMKQRVKFYFQRQAAGL
jgi:hypothetical protein